MGCFVVVVALGGAVAVAADKEEPTCLAETRRICPLVPTGLVQACLQGHRSELSPECRKHLGEVNDTMNRLERDGRSDTQRFCPGPQTAAGQRAACLSEHVDELSPRCREAYDAASHK
jgi:hypothetical protein